MMEKENAPPKISKLLFFVAALAVAISSVLPWVFAQQTFPDEPIEVTSIYRSRMGDIEYYPLVSELAELKFAGHTIQEHQGTIRRSFPNLTIAIHSVCFAIFGAWGFAAGDVVVGWIYLLVAFCFFRTLRMSSHASLLAALFLTLRVPESLYEFGVPGPWDVLRNIWRSRLPRPIVAEPLLLFALTATMRLLFADEPSKYRHWLLLGLAYGLPLQGDIHVAILLAIASPILLILLRRIPLVNFVQCVGVSMIPYALFLIPFFVRRLYEHPDIPVRWGVFSVNRLQPLVIREDLAWFLFAAAIFAVTLAFIRWSETKAWRSMLDGHGFDRGTMSYFCVFILIGFWSATISGVLLGKTIQIYQFSTRSRTLLAYFLFLTSVMALDVVVCHLVRRYRLKLHANIVSLTMVGLLFSITVAHGATRSTFVARENHIRGVFKYLDNLSPSYRKSLTELVNFMDDHVADKSVVVCFDQAVFAHWLTYRDGYWFLVEPFVSNLPDAELEKRLMLVCKQLEMTPEDFAQFVRLYEITLYWLGMGKYQATLAHTFSDIDDYTPEQQDRIRQSTVRDPWKLEIPISEIDRLQRAYAATSMTEFENRKLDVIVLTNDAGQRDFAPPPDTWALRFENQVFRLYTRKQ